MNPLLILFVGVVWLGGAVVAAAHTNEAAMATATQNSTLKTTLSEQPFLGTKSVLTLGGDYVNSPKEDYEMSGVGRKPLSLEEMHGVIAEIGFGEAIKQGEWELRFKHKLKTMDPAWQGIADGAHGHSLTDRRGEVLKFSYNLRDWWQVGVAALVDDKGGADHSFDIMPLSLRNGESLGVQIDAQFKF